MGLFRSSFVFLLGMSCGIYIDQNYDVPKIKQLADTWLFKAKKIEETYRKSKDEEWWSFSQSSAKTKVFPYPILFVSFVANGPMVMYINNNPV